MSLKKVISVALSATITAGAMLAGTAFAAEQTTNYNLSAYDTAASTEAQNVVISSEFTVHLDGNNRDSISNEEINFYREADEGSSTPTGYIVFTPACSGTLALNLKASSNARNNGARLYAKEVTEVTAEQINQCIKSVYDSSSERLFAEGEKAASTGASTVYLKKPTHINVYNSKNISQRHYTFEGGKTYILYPYTYDSVATLSFKDFAYTYTIYEATEYDGYTNDEKLDNPDAKGFTATFAVEDGSSVNSLTWYLKKGTGDWKELGTGTLPEIKSGDIKVGLIVYDLPDGVTAEDISAGYTYTQTIQ